MPALVVPGVKLLRMAIWAEGWAKDGRDESQRFWVMMAKVKLRRNKPVSYTHLTLPTNREV